MKTSPHRQTPDICEFVDECVADEFCPFVDPNDCLVAKEIKEYRKLTKEKIYSWFDWIKGIF